MNSFLRGKIAECKKYGISLHLITKIESITESSKQSELHDEYWVAGVLMKEPVVGEKIMCVRVSNTQHPEGRDGVFFSSRVISIDGDIYTTQNSKYRIEKLS